MERKYNMAATSTIPAGRKSSILILGGTHRVSSSIDHYAFSSAIEPVTDFMLAKMRSMTPEEAAAAAAQAVAEAEAAIAAAEEAMREAEAAEADAKAAQAFVDAALRKLRERETHEMVPCLMESGTRDSQLERPSD